MKLPIFVNATGKAYVAKLGATPVAGRSQPDQGMCKTDQPDALQGSRYVATIEASRIPDALGSSGCQRSNDS